MGCIHTRWRGERVPALTCSLGLCVWSHPRLFWTEWRWTTRCRCPQTADWRRGDGRYPAVVQLHTETFKLTQELHTKAAGVISHSLWGSRYHHLSQCFVGFLPVCVRRSTEQVTLKSHLLNICNISFQRSQYSLWHNSQQRNKILWVKHKIILLHDVSQAPGQQAPPGGRPQHYNDMNLTLNLFHTETELSVFQSHKLSVLREAWFKGNVICNYCLKVTHTVYDRGTETLAWVTEDRGAAIYFFICNIT